LPIEPLERFLTFVTSGARGWAEFYSTTGTRFIRSLDVQMNYIGDKDPAFVMAPNNAEARRTKVKSDDVLLTITGSRIGRVSPVPPELEGAFISQHVAILRLESQRLHPEFLSYFLSLDAGGQRQIASAQYGQTKPGLNFDQIRRFKIPVPTSPDQREFVRRVHCANRIGKVMNESPMSPDHLFACLQQRAFRGEL
jgi:type I restriction enzyme S subunit